MRRLALVSLEHRRPGDPPVALGVASIAASLKKRGLPHQVFSENVAEPTVDTTALASRIIAAGFTDAAIGAFIWNEPQTHSLGRELSAAGLRICTAAA